MEKIPAPYATRKITPWHTYADGIWRKAVRGTDFTSMPSTYARAGRAYAKRHQCTAEFIVKGNTVRFVIIPDTIQTYPFRIADQPAPETDNRCYCSESSIRGPHEPGTCASLIAKATRDRIAGVS